jgi:hypothetical protein
MHLRASGWWDSGHREGAHPRQPRAALGGGFKEELKKSSASWSDWG